MSEERARETLERGFCGRLATVAGTLDLIAAYALATFIAAEWISFAIVDMWA